MPRLHLGKSDRRRSGGRPSVAASSTSRSSSSLPMTHAGNNNAGNTNTDGQRQQQSQRSELDQFDYNDGSFDFDDDDDFNISSSNPIGGGGGNNNNSNKTRNNSSLPSNKSSSSIRKMTLCDSSDSPSFSSSSGEELLVDLSTKKKSSAAMTRKKTATGIVGGMGQSRKVKPTVTSPTITISDLSKANNKKKKSNPTNQKKHTMKLAAVDKQKKNKPLGKPIKRPNKESNDENTENHKQQQQQQQQQHHAATTANNNNNNKGKRKMKKQQQYQRGNDKEKVVSFSNHTKRGKGSYSSSRSSSSSGSDDGDDDDYDDAIVNRSSNIGSSNKKSKTKGGGGKKKQSNAYINCLQDTDDDESSKEEEVEEVMIVEKKKKNATDAGAGANKRRRKQPSTITSNSTMSNYQVQQQQVAVLPPRALAIDNRAIPTINGDVMARHSFLGYIPRLLEDGLERGVLAMSGGDGDGGYVGGDSTIVASLAHGTKEKCSQANNHHQSGGSKLHRGKKRAAVAGALVQMAVVPRVSYLFEKEDQEENGSSWLSNLLAPINSGFEGRDDSINNEEEGNDKNMLGDSNHGLFDYGNEYADNNNVDPLDRSGAMARSNGGNYSSNEVIYRGPNGFAAGDSWSFFGDLVEAIEYKLSHSTPNSNNHHQASRPITLFTTDANLFGDIQSSAHIHGLEQFWKRLHSTTPDFQTNSTATSAAAPTVSAVTIMVVETTNTSAMQMMNTIKNHDSYNSSSGDDGDEQQQHRTSLLPNRLHVIQCVNDIRRRIRELNEAQQQLESSTSEVKKHVNVQIEFMEGNAVSFQSLLQTWVNESFTKTYASLCDVTSSSYDGGRTSHSERGGGGNGGSGVQGRLRFDMPETLDGIMCSISLDLKYTVLPHSIHSPATMGLVEDMRRISMLSQSSSLEVVQTIPLSAVDSSLIYGVPMSARAGLENDISRYNEMKLLARQLWKYLSRNELALALRVRRADDTNDDGLDPKKSSKSSMGYHSSRDELFLLVCEEAVQKKLPQALGHDSNLDPSDALKVVPNKHQRGESPCHGMLYRYATKSQILRFGNEERTPDTEEEENSSLEMSQHYLDYIEHSLDTLVKAGLNPLLM